MTPETIAHLKWISKAKPFAGGWNGTPSSPISITLRARRGYRTIPVDEWDALKGALTRMPAQGVIFGVSDDALAAIHTNT